MNAVINAQLTLRKRVITSLLTSQQNQELRPQSAASSCAFRPLASIQPCNRGVFQIRSFQLNSMRVRPDASKL